MTDFIPTYDVLRALCDQASAKIEDIDNSVVFDGPLNDAIGATFGQSLTASSGKVAVFFGISVDQPERRSGSGSPVTSTLRVDAYLVVRKSGKKSYEDDIRRLLYISDQLMFLAFDHTVWGEDLKSMVRVISCDTRTRQDVTGDGVLAHRLIYTVTPNRVVK